MDMNYRQLQATLKDARSRGFDCPCRLNSKMDVLLKAYKLMQLWERGESYTYQEETFKDPNLIPPTWENVLVEAGKAAIYRNNWNYVKVKTWLRYLKDKKGYEVGRLSRSKFILLRELDSILERIHNNYGKGGERQDWYRDYKRREKERKEEWKREAEENKKKYEEEQRRQRQRWQEESSKWYEDWKSKYRDSDYDDDYSSRWYSDWNNYSYSSYSTKKEKPKRNFLIDGIDIFAIDINSIGWTVDAKKLFGSSKKEIKLSWRKLAMKYHPDHGGDTEVFQQLNNIHEELCQIVAA